MNFLLDTHALIWWMAAPERFSRRAYDCVKDAGARLFVSAASVYEIEYKRERDRLLYRLPRNIPRIVPMLGFEWLNIDPADAFDAARLDNRHRDPWDRIIATQAERRGLRLITADEDLISACVHWRVQTVW
ncbi:type II toxin-antitoxin system VapC family toxin [Caulobacter sp. LARHSG274]